MPTTAGRSLGSTHWRDDPIEAGRAAGFGLYLHVPFCGHRCGYCDFATWDDRDGWIPRYVRALSSEIQQAEQVSGRAVTSVFVGGGTPTRLPVSDLTGVIELTRRVFALAPDAEVTVECNPDDASLELFSALVDVGVTRLSIGAQSFVPAVLSTLERTHGGDGPRRAVALARAAGINQVSLDLIYGTPGESERDWERSLTEALATGPDHLSAYALTIHSGTPFGRRVAEGSLPAPDDDVLRHRFDVARTVLADAGFDHYELSNWARTRTHRSRHNVLYWRHGDYLAFGVGAHGHLDGHRWWNYRSIPRYVEAVETGQPPVAGSETLGTGARAVERLALGLRLRSGILDADLPLLADGQPQECERLGLVETVDGRLRATDDGWFLLDESVRRLLA